MGTVILSQRLKALCHMVTPGKKVVDVGCDHGFVSIYLVQQQISPGALAMDVRSGPLSRATEHITEWGLDNYIETRLSDGLSEYHVGEAQTMICAGMGGRLMEKILTESREKARSLHELILQPQSELPEFRKFLLKEGYEFLDENIIYEDGKYYFLMKVRWSGQTTLYENHWSENDLGLQFGLVLLQRRHPVLKEFLKDSLQKKEQIAVSLGQNENDRARQRLVELREEMDCLKQALTMYEEDI